jgi:hypothetical protein
MPRADLYTKALLIVIAVLLVLNTLGQLRGPAVHAEPTSSQYGIELVKVRWPSKQFQADLATAINDAAKGRELVTLVPFGQTQYLAVYK